MTGTFAFSLNDIAARLGGEVIGGGDIRYSGIAPLQDATAQQLAFLANPKYRKQLDTTRAGAVIVGESERDATKLPRIVTPNPYAYYSRVVALFHPEHRPLAGVHAHAVVDASAQIGSGASIGAFAVIGKHARIGANAVIGIGCVIGDGVAIGDGSRLYPRVVVYHDCVIGNNCVFHSGVVIGADGFGLANENGRWLKIPQVGRVVIGDDVEVGANTTIDRGAMGDTVIEEGVKLDNQIQIGHNCRIGAHTAIAGCAGIAGSTKIGKRCTIGGSAGIVGHIEIGDDVYISGFTLVSKSVPQPGTYTSISSTPFTSHADWLKLAAHLRNLDTYAEKLKLLQDKIKLLEQDK
ncbi:MAG: UDP-3-O-(3-hydroxymyristoyl)glucosamine N-acyltransferase [Burkholderiales bacterium]